LTRAYPFRAFVLWLALHAFVAVASEDKALAFSTAASIGIVFIAAMVGFVDTRRRHEITMLGNLGIPPVAPVALWAATVFVLEALLRAASLAGLASR